MKQSNGETTIKPIRHHLVHRSSSTAPEYYPKSGSDITNSESKSKPSKLHLNIQEEKNTLKSSERMCNKPMNFSLEGNTSNNNQEYGFDRKKNQQNRQNSSFGSIMLESSLEKHNYRSDKIQQAKPQETKQQKQSYQSSKISQRKPQITTQQKHHYQKSKILQDKPQATAQQKEDMSRVINMMKEQIEISSRIYQKKMEFVITAQTQQIKDLMDQIYCNQLKISAQEQLIEQLHRNKYNIYLGDDPTRAQKWGDLQLIIRGLDCRLAKLEELAAKLKSWARRADQIAARADEALDPQPQNISGDLVSGIICSLEKKVNSFESRLNNRTQQLFKHIIEVFRACQQTTKGMAKMKTEVQFLQKQIGKEVPSVSGAQSTPGFRELVALLQTLKMSVERNQMHCSNCQQLEKKEKKKVISRRPAEKNHSRLEQNPYGWRQKGKNIEETLYWSNDNLSEGQGDLSSFRFNSNELKQPHSQLYFSKIPSRYQDVEEDRVNMKMEDYGNGKYEYRSESQNERQKRKSIRSLRRPRKRLIQSAKEHPA